MQVDVGIIEVGIGGTHDSTNVLVSPFCAGVATIGLDHQALLGNTTIEIAAQKGGIYKVCFGGNLTISWEELVLI
jgi:folylpolyglutamate synthase